MCEECEEAEAEFKRIKDAVEPLGHVPKYVRSEGHTVSYVCSCGWEGDKYWDLIEAALEKWITHAKEILEKDKSRLKL